MGPASPPGEGWTVTEANRPGHADEDGELAERLQCLADEIQAVKRELFQRSGDIQDYGKAEELHAKLDRLVAEYTRLWVKRREAVKRSGRRPDSL